MKSQHNLFRSISSGLYRIPVGSGVIVPVTRCSCGLLGSYRLTRKLANLKPILDEAILRIMGRMLRKEFIIAPILEAALILVLALAGWVSHSPLVFASLGPTAFEMIETPERPSARPYNILAGNAVALLASFAALWIAHAWYVPSVSSLGVPLSRVWAGALAAMLTVFGTLLIRATQPAAVSTALLVSLGMMQTIKDAAIIFAAIAGMVAIGEPIRRLRIRTRRATHQSVLADRRH